MHEEHGARLKEMATGFMSCNLTQSNCRPLHASHNGLPSACSYVSLFYLAFYEGDMMKLRAELTVRLSHAHLIIPRVTINYN
jgi:hypothetical protein